MILVNAVDGRVRAHGGSRSPFHTAVRDNQCRKHVGPLAPIAQQPEPFDPSQRSTLWLELRGDGCQRQKRWRENQGMAVH